MSTTQSTSVNTGEINTPCSPPSSPESPSAIALSLFAFNPVNCPGKAAALSLPSVWTPHFTAGLTMLVGGLLTDFLCLAGGAQSVFNVASSALVTTQRVENNRLTPGAKHVHPFLPCMMPPLWGRERLGGFQRARRSGARAAPATCSRGQGKTPLTTVTAF